jgi:putative aminopeptidase FrvX
LKRISKSVDKRLKIWYNKIIKMKGSELYKVFTNKQKRGNVHMKKMRKQLIKLLNIHGISSDETRVRNYLKPILEDMMDTVEVDHYGNLLATKTIGNGEGATVLLSAHMDTVRGVLADRKVLENNGIFTSSAGALGADDRAGIAIIMEVLRNIDKLSFEGTVKVAFSREEEIGCVGSGKIDPKWYEDVNLAIVVDRRGNRDIVVGCGGAFCSDEVGHFMENCSALQGMNYQAVEGGISDAMTFSENGVNSVNLSAGYMNEHTEREYVVFADMCDTARLILQVFGVINNHFHKFGDVPRENQWVQTYGGRYGGYGSKHNSSSYNKYYFEDRFENDIYADVFEKNGDVFVYEIGADVVIQQGNNEVIMSRENLKSLFEQIKHAL